MACKLSKEDDFFMPNPGPMSVNGDLAEIEDIQYTNADKIKS